MNFFLLVTDLKTKQKTKSLNCFAFCIFAFFVFVFRVSIHAALSQIHIEMQQRDFNLCG